VVAKEEMPCDTYRLVQHYSGATKFKQAENMATNR